MATDESKVEEIFFSALGKGSAEELAAYLDEACEGDEPLRNRVQKLLDAKLKLGSFLQGDAGNIIATVDQPITEKPGTQIGPYKLLQQLGEGGMGVVYMAEQKEPVKRRVALKIIKPGMDTRQVIARFEAERQALAMMDHPNIAKVLDAGATESGRPYFVMELVNGLPVTKYCDEQHLTPKERLELFVPICQAVQHAHQKGIIHRDLKPSNILVALYDGRAVPKIIDFGVAKATSQTLTEKTMFTQLGQVVGTLEYMSPEQAQRNQLNIDTRSDVYSLGVVLYELLTGETPFDRARLQSAAFEEMLRIIREEEPSKPSTKVSSSQSLPSIAANRRIEPAKLGSMIRGELDWIVLKAMEKDRGRRYETASKFAEDVQHYLNDEAVVACPPSTAYRVRKFARRHKRALATAFLIGVVMIAALGSVMGTVGWALRDRVARQNVVEREAGVAIEESERLLADGNFADALSSAKRAEGILAGQGSKRMGDYVAQLRRDIDFALRLEAIRLTRAVINTGTDRDPRMESTYRNIYQEYGIDVEVLPRQTAVEKIAASRIRDELILGLDDWLVLNSWQAHTPQWQSRYALVAAADPDRCRNQIRQTLDSSRRMAILEELAHPDNASSLTARSVWPLVHSPTVTAAPDQVELILRTVWQQDPTDFWVNFGLAYVLCRVTPPRWQEATRFYTAALAVRPDSIATLVNLGATLKEQNRWDEAIACYRRAIELDPQASGPHHNLGLALYRQRKLDEAIACCQKAIELDPDNAQACNSLGLALMARGNREEAIAWYQKAIEIDPKYADPYNNLGIAEVHQGKPGEAIASFRRAVELAPKLASAWNNLGNVLKDQGILHESIACYCKAIEIDPKHVNSHYSLGTALSAKGEVDGAIASYRRALQLYPDHAGVCNNLAWLLANCPDSEIAKLTEAVELARKAVKLEPTNRGYANTLGAALCRAGEWKEAIVALETSMELGSGGDSNDWFFLAIAHWHLGDREKAHTWYDRAAKWMDQRDPGNGELARFRADAAMLLGVDNASRKVTDSM